MFPCTCRKSPVAAKQIIYHLTLPSTLKAVSRIEGFLKKVNRSVHLDEIQMHKLMVSLTEAVNNAIVHGNKQDPQKKVSVVCEVLPGWLLFVVRDQGKGFRYRRKSPLGTAYLSFRQGSDQQRTVVLHADRRRRRDRFGKV